MSSEPPTLDAAVDELYSLDPEGFVARRTELAKAARAAKDRAVAQQIAALRRPTVGAWMLNQAVRASLTSVVAVLHLARDIRAAEAAQDAGRVRDLVAGRAAAERRALHDLEAFMAARGVDVKPAAREEMRTTLRAVSTDPVVADALGAGRLEKAGDPGELDLMAMLGAMTSDLAPRATPSAAGQDADAGVRSDPVSGEGIAFDEPAEDARTDTRMSPRPTQEAPASEAAWEPEPASQAPDPAAVARQRAAEALAEATAAEKVAQDRLDRSSAALAEAQRTLDQARQLADELRQQVEAAEAEVHRSEEALEEVRDDLSSAALDRESARSHREQARRDLEQLDGRRRR